MNDELSLWGNTTTEGITTVPGEVGTQDGYMLLLSLLSIFIGGMLVLLFICRHCCEMDRWHSRASDDPEKTNTTYLDDSQLAQEITIKVDDPDGMSSTSYQDTESECFLSSGNTSGRRVSFNEATLFEQSKKTQEKGRRYTLTEGDFHHLKNARLSHLPLPPSATLKIITIHECESNDNSVAMTAQCPPAKPSLTFFQPLRDMLPQTALTSHAMCLSSALPGDTFNSTIETGSTISLDSSKGTSLDAAPRGPKGAGVSSGAAREPAPAPSPGTVTHFFTRLRRYTSLEGASPYFKTKKWKLETSQRASSLDMRGSPKRHQFQRQQAASESMDQEDQDAHQTDIIQYIARTDSMVFRTVAGPFLPAPANPSLSIGRLDPSEPPAPTESPPLDQQPTPICHDIWSLRASLELCALAEQGNDWDSIHSEGEDSASLSGGLPSIPSSLVDEAEGGDDLLWEKPKPEGVEVGPRKLLQMDSGYASIEGPSGHAGEGQTASEKRSCFTSAGHRATVFESFDPAEEEEVAAPGRTMEGSLPHSLLAWALHGQLFSAWEGLPHRDYSIDKKTDALFHAFIHHDPQFDESPLQAKLRSHVHLRKQWQRAKQHSDPGARYPTVLDWHRTPLQRGNSINYPSEGRCPGALLRITSTGNKEAPLWATNADEKIQAIAEEQAEEAKGCGDPVGGSCPKGGQCPVLGPLRAELMNKIAVGLEDGLHLPWRRPQESPRCVMAVADTSPGHSPK